MDKTQHLGTELRDAINVQYLLFNVLCSKFTLQCSLFSVHASMFNVHLSQQFVTS